MSPKKTKHIVEPKDLSSDPSQGIVSSSKIQLSDEEKRHAIVGIALNSVLIPQLKAYVEKQMRIYYIQLTEKYKINTTNSTLNRKEIKNLELGLNIHERHRHPKKDTDTIRNVLDHNALAKLYLQEFMSRTFKSITDDATDSSAILTILIRSPQFDAKIR